VGAGVPFERGRQRRVPPLKRRYFPIIGSYSLKTVADSYKHAARHNKHWWFLDAAHISIVNCDEMAGDRPRLPAYEIFSIKRKFSQ